MARSRKLVLDPDEAQMLQQVMDRRRQELEIRGGGPAKLGSSIREVIAKRKIGRQLQSQELSQLWRSAVPDDIAPKTRVVSLRNHVLLVEVTDSVLLSEMASFHQRMILRTLNATRPDMQIQSLKFKINASLNSRS